MLMLGFWICGCVPNVNELIWRQYMADKQSHPPLTTECQGCKFLNLDSIPDEQIVIMQFAYSTWAAVTAKRAREIIKARNEAKP
jgi:hypothetical protein